MQGKRGDELLCETINGAADGYLVGAVTGLVSGGAKAYKLAKEANALKDISGTETIFGENVYDETGKLIGKYDPKWHKTEKCVRDIEKNGLDNLTTAQKGNYGEMKTDLFMRDRGYERVSKTKITSLADKGHQGLDGVYYNPNGKPPYVIADAKFGSATLKGTNDGLQMTDDWIFGKITGNNRLVEDVGKDIADDIEMMGYEKVLVHIDGKTGECTAQILNDSAKGIGAW